MEQVTKEEFFAAVGPLDVSPNPTGNYPYVSEWKLRNGRVIGRSCEDRYELEKGYRKASELSR